MSNMQTTDAKRADEVDALLLQLDSTLRALAVMREQISRIPDMVMSVVDAEVVPDLLVGEESSISEQVSVVISSLIENLWERGNLFFLPSVSLIYCAKPVYGSICKYLMRFAYIFSFH
jgi:hypothetical protein